MNQWAQAIFEHNVIQGVSQVSRLARRAALRPMQMLSRICCRSPDVDGTSCRHC